MCHHCFIRFSPLTITPSSLSPLTNPRHSLPTNNAMSNPSSHIITNPYAPSSSINTTDIQDDINAAKARQLTDLWMSLSAAAVKMFIEYDTKNKEQSTDMKTAIKNINDEVGQLRSDFDQLETRLQDVQIKQEQLQIGQDRKWARQEQMQIGQDKLQNDMREVLSLLRTEETNPTNKVSGSEVVWEGNSDSHGLTRRLRTLVRGRRLGRTGGGGF